MCSDLMFETSIAKSNEPCYVKMESCFCKHRRPIATQIEKSVDSIGETHANQVVERTKSVDNEESIHIDDGKWKNFNRNTLSAEISKFVVRLVRHYDQHERETDGAVHWNSKRSKLRDAFQTSGGPRFSDKDWLRHIQEGSSKTRFQYCENSLAEGAPFAERQVIVEKTA